MSPSAPADAARASAYLLGTPGQHVELKPGGSGLQSQRLRYVSGASAGADRQRSFKPGDAEVLIELPPVGGGYLSLVSTAADASRPGGLTASTPTDAAIAPRQLAQRHAAHLAPGEPELQYKLPPVGEGYIHPASQTGWPGGPALSTPANTACAPRRMAEERAVCPAEGEDLANVLATALHQMLQLARSLGRRIAVPIPTYRGYSDKQSANDILLALRRYELASDLSEWYQLAGHTAGSMADFRSFLMEAFFPYDYELRMRRELQLQTQAPDE